MDRQNKTMMGTVIDVCWTEKICMSSYTGSSNTWTLQELIFICFKTWVLIRTVYQKNISSNSHHRNVQHCKSWYLFLLSEYNGSKKQDNGNRNRRLFNWLKKYLWVLTPHHQTLEHCKNWCLFVYWKKLKFLFYWQLTERKIST